jgi:hypothetical protein
VQQRKRDAEPQQYGKRRAEQKHARWQLQLLLPKSGRAYLLLDLVHPSLSVATMTLCMQFMDFYR